MSDDSDLALLDRFAATGDEVSFAALVERHAGMVLGVAWRRTQEWTSAEEITQNVFAILARKARSLRHANLAGWLYQAALLEARNSFRKAARYRAVLDQFSRETMNTPYSMDPSWQHLYPHLDAAISRLPTEAQTLVVMRYFEKRSISEIAAVTGKSAEACRKRIQRSVEMIERFLRGRGLGATGTALTAVLEAQHLTVSATSAAAIATAALEAAPALTTASLTLHALPVMNTPTILKATAIAIVIAAIPITIRWQRDAARKAAAQSHADQAANVSPPLSPPVGPALPTVAGTPRPSRSAAPPIVVVGAANPDSDPASTPDTSTESLLNPPPTPPAADVPVVVIRGSDSMIGLVMELAKAFHDSSFPLPTVSGGGSGVGIAALANVTADICTMSRPMKAEEKARIEKEGRLVTEIIVAYDSVAICVHKTCPIEAISMDQLRAVWIKGDVRTWNALGAKTPDADIFLLGRPTSSGQMSLFGDMLRLPDQRASFVEGVTVLKTEAELLDAIANNPQAMGYARPGKGIKGVKLLPVATTTGAKPVPATATFMADGSYPLSRPLYFYTTTPDEPGTKEFIAFTKSNAGQKIVEQEGFTPLPAGTTAAPQETR